MYAASAPFAEHCKHSVHLRQSRLTFRKVTTVQKSVAGERLRKISSNGFGEVRTIEDERGMPEEAWRLFRRSLLSVLIDAQSADLRVQGLAWYPEFRRCSGGSGYSPMALGESSFDHLNFAIRQCRKAFVSR